MRKSETIKILSLIIVTLIFLQIISCKKDDGPESVTDIDGNEYGLVTIGDQVWMKANLRTTKYNDGTEIPYVTDNTEWSNLTSGAYCWCFNDMSNQTPYGALYNWYTITPGKLCPTGWRIPSDQDWFELVNYLGGVSIAGGKLKTPGGWLEPNVGATNETGFTAYPAGRRSVTDEFKGVFNGIEAGVTWWSSTEFSTTEAYYRHIEHSGSHVESHYYNKRFGFSVRCIKDGS